MAPRTFEAICAVLCINDETFPPARDNMRPPILYWVKHNSTKFSPGTKVKFITCTYSGECYLVADLNNDLNREWIMNYDLQEAR